MQQHLDRPSNLSSEASEGVPRQRKLRTDSGVGTRSNGHHLAMPCSLSGQTPLCLAIPQWQGWGMSKEQYHGCLELVSFFSNRIPVQLVDIDSEEELAVIDGILGKPGIVETLSRVRQRLLASTSHRVLVLGGDCSVDIAPIAYLNALYQGNLTVLWLDAHGDLNTPTESLTHRFHGMPIRTLLGEGDADILRLTQSTLEARQFVLVGARDFDPLELSLLQRVALSHLNVEAVRENPASLIQAIKTTGRTNVHIHVDFDVLDPKVFGDLNTPAAGGFDVSEVSAILECVAAHFNIVGMTMTEYCPRDRHGLSKLGPILAFVNRKWTEW
jgi:arginase